MGVFLKRMLPLTISVTLGFILFPVPPAGAVGCLHGGGVMTVQTGEGESASVGRSTDALTVNGVACGPATVTNTDTILWDDLGAGGGETFVISLGGGPFAPGMTDEPDTTDEIEFDLSSDLQVQADDFVSIIGSPGNDFIRVGDAPMGQFAFSSASVNLIDFDLDADVSLFTQNIQIQGLAGNDSLTAKGGFGTGAPFQSEIGLHGQLGNDILSDGDNNDTITGGDGNDRWFVGLGQDDAEGGTGLDTVDAAFHPNGVDADLNQGTISGSESDVFIEFEAFSGSPFDDTATGGGTATTDGVVLRGKQGNDTLFGTNGIDLILGGQGTDTLRGFGGADVQRGNDGDDDIRDEGGEDLLAGGGGEDLIRGGGADDTLRGQGQDDNLGGNAGDDILNGGTSEDRCIDKSGDNAFRSCEIIFGPPG